jgi:hypothetical protein
VSIFCCCVRQWCPFPASLVVGPRSWIRTRSCKASAMRRLSPPNPPILFESYTARRERESKETEITVASV